MVWLWLGLTVVIAAVVLWPRFGLLALGRRWRTMAERAVVEDALKHLLECRQAGRGATEQSLRGALRLGGPAVLRVVAKMESADLLRSSGGGLTLTGNGRRLALQIVRAHRLWELWLADEAGMPLSRVHRVAERAEHQLSPEQVASLDAHLGHPTRDPHGDPIPSASGQLQMLSAVPLTDWPMNRPGRIMHIEDEPIEAFQQIASAGFKPGVQIRILERDADRLVVGSDEDEHTLAPVIAANIHIADIEQPRTITAEAMRLWEVSEDEEVEIVELDPACRGFNRRRILDLGFTPGARLRRELTGAFGRARAYRVRGTLIALRDDQAAQIWVRPVGEPEATAAQQNTEVKVK